MQEQTGQKEQDSNGGQNGWSWRRMVPLLVLLLGTILFFGFGLDDYLSFDALRQHNETLLVYVSTHLVLTLAAYFLVYVVAIACSLPGGLLLTVIGGYLFGIAIGGTCVVVAATIGATLIFLAAKTALGDPLRAKAGPAMRKMESDIRRNAFNYLLVLRLIPLFPFFLVNLAPAFLGVGLRTYVAATFLGIIPATFIFSSVGNGLGALLEAGREPSAKLLMAPEILLPLIGLSVLALVPVVYRRYKARPGNDE